MSKPQIFIGDRVVEVDFGLNHYSVCLDGQSLSDYLKTFVKRLEAYEGYDVLVDPALALPSDKEFSFKSGFSMIGCGDIIVRGFCVLDKKIILLSGLPQRHKSLMVGRPPTDPLLLTADRWIFETDTTKVEIQFLVHLVDHADHGGFYIVKLWDREK